MKTKLQEALELVNDMTADVNGEYPVGLIRVRRLLEEVLTDEADEEDRFELAVWPEDEEIVILELDPPQGPPAA